LITIIKTTKTLILIAIFIILFTLSASAVVEPNWQVIKNRSLNNLEENPDDIKANYNLVISHVNLGDIKAAYNKIDEFDSTFDEAKFIDTISPYLKEVNKYPDSILILNYCAFYGVVMEDYNISIRYFNQILELTPNNYNIRNFLAASHIELNQYDTAVKEINKALDTQDNEFSHLLMGIVHYERGNLIKALSEFSKSGSLGRELIK
jgi:tetratricopeptide (TPR) repeat protein